MGEPKPVRIGILWRGDRSANPVQPDPSRGLRPLFDAFAELPVILEPIVFDERAVAEVREQLRGLDGLLAWVNPVQHGVNRAVVDDLVREAADSGVFVSAHPDVIAKLGTKEVLYRTRHLKWGSDVELYPDLEDFASRFPLRLAEYGQLVVKQGRGNGGHGVWKVTVLDPAAAVGLQSQVEVVDAKVRGESVRLMTLEQVVELVESYLPWSGFVVDQPFQARLAEGMVRCYFSGDEVVGFSDERPTGLLDLTPAQRAALVPRPSVMHGPDAAAHQLLRREATAWVQEVAELLEIDTDSLPVIWDADLFLGPPTGTGAESYVLCEINVSAVWPFPPMAARTVANAALTGSRRTSQPRPTSRPITTRRSGRAR